jgi:hypothetical protein
LREDLSKKRDWIIEWSHVLFKRFEGHHDDQGALRMIVPMIVPKSVVMGASKVQSGDLAHGRALSPLTSAITMSGQSHLLLLKKPFLGRSSVWLFERAQSLPKGVPSMVEGCHRLGHP